MPPSPSPRSGSPLRTLRSNLRGSELRLRQSGSLALPPGRLRPRPPAVSDGEPNLTYDIFAATLPADECRYCIYDFDFVIEQGCQKSKIFFIAWSPDTAKIRSKMLYASSKDRFKRELDGIQVEFQATDPTEMGLDAIRGRAN